MRHWDLIVHCSNSELGGAERSLLDGVSTRWKGRHVLFVLPSEGGLSRRLRREGMALRVLPWPNGLERLSRVPGSPGLALGFRLLPGLLLYLMRLLRLLRHAGKVYSSGVKSHLLLLPLLPWLRGRVAFDIRDFIRPLWVQRCIAWGARFFRAEVMANSHTVGRAYPRYRVSHPHIRLERPVQNRRVAGGPLVIAHVAYFAPYKGQDRFLKLARALLDAGVDAEFRLAGDVIYPGWRHTAYRDAVHALCHRLGLVDKVQFLGAVEDVQELLETCDVQIHCTHEPEPFGRVVMEGLLCGCQVLCHRESGVCEVARPLLQAPVGLEPVDRVVREQGMQDLTWVKLPFGIIPAH